MSVFTPAEIEYLVSQRIGRVATIDAKGNPHVVPLRFVYNPDLDVIDLVGKGMGTSKKYRDTAATGRAAFVIDDTSPEGKPRGIEIRGHAHTLTEGGAELARGVDPQFIRITPTRIASWGIDTEWFRPVGRDVG